MPALLLVGLKLLVHSTICLAFVTVLVGSLVAPPNFSISPASAAETANRVVVATLIGHPASGEIFDGVQLRPVVGHSSPSPAPLDVYESVALISGFLVVLAIGFAVHAKRRRVWNARSDCDRESVAGGVESEFSQL